MFPPQTKILVVDDLKTIRNILIDLLWRLGYKELHECGDGKTALNMLKEAHAADEKFDLIICDWNMPEFTGIDLLNAKNDDPNLKDTPFLMVTIESERAYVLKAIALGVDDFVVKPFNENTIIKKLKNVWERKLQTEEQKSS